MSDLRTRSARTAEAELALLMEALAETSLELPPETIVVEVREEAADPRVVALGALQRLQAAGRHYRQRLLRSARAEYLRVREVMQSRWVDLPDSPDERRRLLQATLARDPRLESAYLTVQHR